MSHKQLDLAALLHREGYRMTAQRQMILDAVCDIHGHATPEQVCRLVQSRWPAVNRATVYRTLKFLTEMGVVLATTAPDGQMEYEIAGPKAHHHIVCRICGRDTEFEDSLLEGLAEQVRRQLDYELESQHVTFTGLCSECRAKE